MPYCPICERKFDDKRGLTGHFRFKHKYELAREKPAKETPMTKAIGRNIERRMSGDAVMKAVEEEKRGKALEFARELEERKPYREAEQREEFNLKGFKGRWSKW